MRTSAALAEIESNVSTLGRPKRFSPLFECPEPAIGIMKEKHSDKKAKEVILTEVNRHLFLKDEQTGDFVLNFQSSYIIGQNLEMQYEMVSKGTSPNRLLTFFDKDGVSYEKVRLEQLLVLRNSPGSIKHTAIFTDLSSELPEQFSMPVGDIACLSLACCEENMRMTAEALGATAIK